MTGYARHLTDLCVEKMRFEAVKCMSRTYRPTIPVSYVAQVLGFASAPEGEGGDEGDVDGLEECMEWLKAHGACLIEDNNGEMMVDAKVWFLVQLIIFYIIFFEIRFSTRARFILACKIWSRAELQ